MKRYIYKMKWTILIQVVFSGLYTVAIALIPYLTKVLFDYDFNRGISGVIYIAGGYACCIIFSALFQNISQVYEWKTAKHFNELIKSDLFSIILKFKYEKFMKLDIGEYISIFNNDIKFIQQDYIDAIIDIIKSINMLLIYGVFLFVFVDIRIAVVISITSLVTVFVPKITSNTLSTRKKIYLSSLGKYTDKLKDILDGFKLVNSATRKNIFKEYNKFLYDSEEKRYSFGKFNTFANILNGFVMDILSLSAFVTIGYLLYKREISVGIGVATLGYIESFIYPIKYILNDINYINSCKETKDRILDLLNLNQLEEKKISSFENYIEFKNVTVKYPNFEIKDFSYRFEKGKKYAIIGHSGSGKSTILNVLKKQTSVTGGKIQIDGENIYDYDLSNIIATINQREHVFGDGFYENSTIYNSYDSGKIADIIKFLNVERLNNLLDVSNCKELSGGEKQLISIIRMFLTNNDILLLDEPFSEIDNKNSILIEEKMFSIKDKTMIFITHKISEKYLSLFDEIILMNEGNIVFRGTSNEVINSKHYQFLNCSNI